jgi:hypothetical protein
MLTHLAIVMLRTDVRYLKMGAHSPTSSVWTWVILWDQSTRGRGKDALKIKFIQELVDDRRKPFLE